MIHNDLSPELIKNVVLKPIVQLQISAFLTRSDPEIHEFPEELLKYYKVTNPLLEFVKLIALVVKLEKPVEQEAIILRRQMLKNMRVKEFAPEAQFIDPYNSFIIPAVFCSYCNGVRNIDMCSDPDLQTSVCHHSMNHIQAKEHQWVCQSCNHEYDMLAIEKMIIDICSRKIKTYLLQDMRCQKCQQLRKNILSRYCSCSGEWVYKEMDPKTLREQLSVVKRKAEFHGMEWLYESLSMYGI